MLRDPSLSVVTGYQSIQSMVARPIAGAVALPIPLWAVNFKAIIDEVFRCSRIGVPGGLLRDICSMNKQHNRLLN